MWVDSELEEDGTLNGGAEMPSVPSRRSKKRSGRPTGHQRVTSLCTPEACYLNVATAERGVPIEARDPGDQDAVRAAAVDADLRRRGREGCKTDTTRL